jgi:hypothetical protein
MHVFTVFHGRISSLTRHQHEPGDSENEVLGLIDDGDDDAGGYDDFSEHCLLLDVITNPK